jgi:peptidoglycan/LPS O-acetylase OafA/YrhL
MANSIKTQHRFALIDTLKGICCLLVLMHHLAFYGPMSDAAHELIPGVIDFLFEYGRMAVSVFLVIGGFLTGQIICKPNIFVKKSVIEFIWSKYIRLIIPYISAIALAITCSFIASQWMQHSSLSASPEPAQLTSHLLLLQNILGYESLSAGLWYVEIDFQLFLISLLLVFIIERLTPASWPYTSIHHISIGIVSLLTISSLFIFNLHESLDTTFLYFYGSYGLGILAAYITREKTIYFLLLLLSIIVAASLYIHFRERILISFMTALLLCLSHQQNWINASIWKNPLAYLGKISYSIFLVHFPISLLFSALFWNLYPHDPLMNMIGMGLSAVSSLLIAIIFYRLIEQRRL